MIEAAHFVLGLILLVGGAELLVRAASRLAAAVGISPLVVGLTVVAYGTSAPELAVSVRAAFADQAAVSIGNVVGSNIFNVLFILGASALIRPLAVSQQLVRWDVPIMIATSLLLLLFGADAKISRMDGTLLFGGAVAYTILAVRQSRRESREIQLEYEEGFATVAPKGVVQAVLQVLILLVGVALLVVGARWLVDSATVFARWAGLSELVIGLTIVAAGTSLPELATSVIAAIRGERDIAVGNVVGSNIFNILCVLGVSGLVAPHGVDVAEAAIRFDIPVMIAVAVACLPVFFTGNLIARWEGALFLAYYAAYLCYLFLDTTRHDALPTFGVLMMGFVIPLTVVTLVIIVVRSLRRGVADAGRLTNAIASPGSSAARCGSPGSPRGAPQPHRQQPRRR